jgi:hypothetical protein
MMVRSILFTLFLTAGFQLSAQMVNGVDTLYGNEWIDYAKTYYKIKVANDGIYRVDYQQLQAAGFPVGSAAGQDLRLYCFGKQVALFISTGGPFTTGDYLEFYGERNKETLDRFLYTNPDGENLNPWYSLFNDTATYYLCLQPAVPALRYTAVSNNLTNLPAKESYCWYTDQQNFHLEFFKRSLSKEITYSWFNGDGFGYYGGPLSNFTLSPKHVFGSVPTPATAIVRYGCTYGSHRIQIHLADSLYTDDIFSNFRVKTETYSLPLSKLTGSIPVKVESVAGQADRHNVSGLTLRYPRTFDFGNAAATVFELDPNPNGQYLELNGLNAGSGALVVYDLTNKIRIEAGADGKVFLPASSLTRWIAVAGVGTGILNGGPLNAYQFHNYAADNANYIIISNPALFHDPTAGGANHVQAYADYRGGASGGAFKSKVYNINDLYEQFAYGVRFHPLAIRNFCYYVKKHFTAPQYLLLIGKGQDYNNFRTTDQQQSLVDSLFFLPDYGAPGADMLYVMAGNAIGKPIFPVGRLAVTKPAQIRAYLDKVIEHEQTIAAAQQTIADKAWMKRFLHISGGLADEQASFAASVQTMTNEISTNAVGAEVQTLYKSSNDPIQQTPYERVLNAVNGGISTWMIFGHSSAFGVDYEIGSVDNYKNKGHYPFMMIMGCFSGICSNPDKGLGENFSLARDKGAIAYLAPVNFSFADALHDFGFKFYQQMGGQDFGKTLGQTIVHTIGSFNPSNNTSLVAILHQIQLQGDPAVRLHTMQGPDYTIDPVSPTVNPNPVSIDQATYDFDFQLINLGRNTGGKVGLKLSQQLPNNTVRLLKIDSVDAPAFKRQMHYTLSATDNKPGFSRLYVQVDPNNKIAETPSGAELNNDLLDATGQKGFNVYFYTDDVRPAWPPNFSIVPSSPVKLYASSLALRNNPIRFRFEIDTLETFSSPFVKKTIIFQPSGLLRWTPPVTYKDSTVYYWRVARDTLGNNAVTWHGSSFLYLKNSPSGWNQSDYGQFIQDDFTTMQWKNRSSKMQFSDDAKSYKVRAAYRGQASSPGIRNSDGEGYLTTYWWGTQNIDHGVAVMQFDPNTGHVIYNPPFGKNNPTPGTKSAVAYFDTRDSLERLNLMDFLQNRVTKYAYVGLVTVDYYNDPIAYAPGKWAADSITNGKNLFQVLESLGAKNVRKLANGANPPLAYAFAFRAKDPTYPAKDTVSGSSGGSADIDPSFNGRWYTGSIESKPIGPATSWTGLYWKRDAFDTNLEQANVEVLGVRDNQPDTVLIKLTGKFDTLLNHISAAKYPYLKLRYEDTDTINHTASPLRFWRVLYKGVPEGALNPAAANVFYKDTLQQGDSLRASIAFSNISNLGMDSLLVRFKLENNNGLAITKLKKYKPLPVGDSVVVSVQLPTRQTDGKQRFTVDVNPDNQQPELSHQNNVYFRDCYVARDLRNPLLDVTFDGYHILNGDIISPKPEVVLTMKDDNRYLAMTDTTTFRLNLQYPDGSTRPIYFTDPSILFFPANPASLPKKNLARLEWRPVFTKDGDYRLLVNGKDASGNASAGLDYAISFKVITASSISNLLNYPNPFSTSTCFVYTMTGAETPTSFRVQILTVSGKVVREITEAEFGPLYAGTHQSQFCWNGKDQYGDQLANGVYLYRIVAKKADGSNFDFFSTSQIDGYFNHGFGKMVLIR